MAAGASPMAAIAANGLNNKGFYPNALARKMILEGPNSALDFTQQCYTNTFSPVAQPILNITPQYVGLLKKFIILVSFTVSNTGGTAITPSDLFLNNTFAPVNGIVFNDLNNNVRIQTGGWHLGQMQTVRRRRPFAASGNFNTADGNNVSQMDNVPAALWPVFTGPSSIAAGSSGTCTAIFEVPISFSNKDLRGAMWINTVNATINLALTMNPAPVSAVGADSTFSIYQGGTGSITTATVTVMQNYLYNLPTYTSGPNGGQPILPLSDLNTIYELKNTSSPNNITQGQDTLVSYPNFRSFQSTLAIYNSNGTTRATGSDINYWALRAASATNIWKYPPQYAAMLTRELLQRDLAPGCYYFSHRDRPLYTTQFGNLNLVFNPSSFSNGGYCVIGWEDFVQQNILASIASLP